jgi:hypothetical protein
MDIDMNPPALDLNTRLTRSADVLTSEVEDDLILLDIPGDEYYGMNPVGRHVWDLLASPRSVAEICESVATQFDIDADRCAPDVLAFAGTLIDAGLVRIVDAPSGPR